MFANLNSMKHKKPIAIQNMKLGEKLAMRRPERMVTNITRAVNPSRKPMNFAGIRCFTVRLCLNYSGLRERNPPGISGRDADLNKNPDRDRDKGQPACDQSTH